MGYCFEGHCHRFPIIVGETGSLFETQADVDSMYGERCVHLECYVSPLTVSLSLTQTTPGSAADIMDYMHNVGAASDGRHNRIGSWMWCVTHLPQVYTLYNLFVGSVMRLLEGQLTLFMQVGLEC